MDPNPHGKIPGSTPCLASPPRTGRVRSPLATLLALAAALSCGESGTEPGGAPASVVLSPATAQLTSLGDTVRLTAEARNLSGAAIPGAHFWWTSSDTAVATVDASGLATALANGTATITASAGPVSGTAALTVAQEPSAVVVTPSSDTLVAFGDTVRLEAHASDAYGHAVAGVAFTWASSDTSVAGVDASGLVRSRAEGSAMVTATASGATGAAEMRVVPPSPSRVVASPDTLAFDALGQKVQLEAEVLDQGGRPMAGVPVSWSGGDRLVAVVDAGGIVTAVGAGVTTVTASAGGASDSVHLVVSDRAVLGAFYHATGGPNWVESTNWLTDAPLGEWYGVRVNDQGRVVGLELAGTWDSETASSVQHGLSGPIPPELESLSNLGRLALDHNDLSGPIPPELGNLSNLESLSLSGNRLSGPIPPELGDLSNLVSLDLDGNDLQGRMPPELGNLSNLDTLSLDANQLSGPIPPELGDLRTLDRLHLGYNDLSGPIPPELGDLWSLRTLDLSGNDLSSELPPELGRLPRLDGLYLYANQLSGTVPAAMLNLPLRSFFWSQDPSLAPGALCVSGAAEFVEWLDGMLSSFGPLCNATDRAALTDLYKRTDGNRWTESARWPGGPILSAWHGVETDSLGRVTALGLSSNGLSGSLPGTIADLARLTRLHIDGNALAGRLPLALTQLDLEEFNYHGTDLCEPAETDFRRWLAGIPARSGTGVQCDPLTDRDILVALYESTGGPGWANREAWLTSAPLDRWHGVEVDAEGRVVSLDLSRNRLAGGIPHELGGLVNLRYLDLGGNDLSSSIPPELGNLANLRSLDLAGNELLGSIPPELGNLLNLESLYLDSNYELSGAIPSELGRLSNLGALYLSNTDLTGPIPSSLGNLSNLRYLLIYRSNLTGPIPSSLGNLSNLWWLSLSNNNLTGPIPSSLGNMREMSLLQLDDNELTGRIPSELGNLSSLRGLRLQGNSLSGAIPASLGNLGELEWLDLTDNNLSGRIPSQLGNLTDLSYLQMSHNAGLTGPIPSGWIDLELESLALAGTDLCAPREQAFADWLATIPRQRIAWCGEPPAAYLVQAVQSLSHPVPLVAGEDALLRVFVTAVRETTEGIPPVRARFYVNGVERHVADIPAGSASIPTEINEGALSKSANATVPGSIVQPGLEMVVEVDPGGTLDASLGVPTRIPAEGRLAVEVREMPDLDLTVIPFVWSTNPDSAVIATVGAMAADPDGHELLDDTRVLLPVADIDVTPHVPVVSSSNNASDLLNQTEAIRVLEGRGGHYMGMMSGIVWGGAGVARMPGRSSFSVPNSGTIAHELGHNMYLRNAPCGVAGDPSFPDPRGAIGAWGYDAETGRLVPPHRKDHMSYCDPTWTSDYHFTNALRHRLADESGSAPPPAAGPALLLWGGLDPADGAPYLNPAFVADAPPALPDSTGDYTVTGLDAAGRELFSLNFTMPVAQSEEGDKSSFVYALPVRPAWADALAGITLTGPAGTATLDAASDNPMAILRDPSTGEVRAFLTDAADPALQAAADAAAGPVGPAGRTAGPRGLTVLFSRGLPDRAAWR